MFYFELSGEELFEKADELFKESGAIPFSVGSTDEELKGQCYTAEQLVRMKGEYKENPLALLEAIAYSNEHGFTAPIWAHSILQIAFRRYEESLGSISLDAVLGLKPERGNSHLLKQRIGKHQKWMAAYYINRLNKYFGFTLPVTYFLLSIGGIEGDAPSSPRNYFSVSYLEEIYKENSDVFEFDEPEPPESKLVDLMKEGYLKLIHSNKDGLKEKGLFDSALRTVNRILRG